MTAAARSSFPLGTLLVNVSGALALGVLIGLRVHGTALVLLGTATLGAFTTFSTWMLESDRLGRYERLRPATANVAASLGAGVAAVALGAAYSVDSANTSGVAHRLTAASARNAGVG